MPDEDQAVIQDRFEAFEAALKPKDSVAQYLVGRMALMSVRMDRSARHESAEITNAMLGAKDTEAEARVLEIRGLLASIGDDPPRPPANSDGHPRGSTGSSGPGRPFRPTSPRGDGEILKAIAPSTCSAANPITTRETGPMC